MARPTRTWRNSARRLGSSLPRRLGAAMPYRLSGPLTRRLGLDGNPLRRPVDRLEAWLAPAATIVFLILAPVLFLVLGTLVRADNAAVTRAERSWHPVTATLLQSAPGPAFDDHGTNTWTEWTRATWTYGGRHYTGVVPAPASSSTGSRETIWLSHAGHVQLPPMSSAQVSEWITGETLLGIGVLVLLLFTAVWLTRRQLERRRIASWELDWLAVEPRWSRQS
jgi:hypothetical protein